MTARIGLVDAGDPRVREAATRLLAEDDGITPVLVRTAAEDSLPRVEQLMVPAHLHPVGHLAELVARGELDAGVAGSVTTSAEVLRAGIRHLRGAGLVSGCFVIRDHQAWRTYADCVVVPAPDAGELAEIAACAADHHRRLFQEEPRVAMLSFSTAGSSTHPRARAVRHATRLLQEARPDLRVVGEVQFDAAVDPVVAAHKAPGSAVAGSANVLVFPSLDAANIAYKVAERLGGARALGSFILGLNRPWVDLSRGCSTEDIVATVGLLGRALRSETAAASATPATPKGLRA